MTQERPLGWDADGMCDDHGRFACQKCAVPDPTPARDGAVSVQEAREDVTQAGDGSDADLVATLERLIMLTPRRANASNAQDLHCSVRAIAESAIARHRLAHTARPDAGDEVERVARALCEQHIRRARRWDTEPADLEAKMPAAVDYNWRDHKDDAHAAIAAIAAKQLHDALARLPTSPEATP